MKYEVIGVKETEDGLATSRHKITTATDLEDVIEDLAEFRMGHIRDYDVLVIEVRK